MKNIFQKGWRSSGTVCGWGSEIEHTANIREDLLEVIQSYNIKTINDAGCGDLNWISTIDLSEVDYLGYDIIPRELWNQQLKCEQLDITKEIMRPSDLIICRDVFIHLPNDLITKSINLFRKSAKYLLSTTFMDVDNAVRIETPSITHAKLDLRQSPFGLGDPLLSIEEDFENKFSCLWRIK
jgi:hypothetical protein